MQSSAELKTLLNRIDHRGYPAYKIRKEPISSRGIFYPLIMCRETPLRRRRR